MGEKEDKLAFFAQAFLKLSSGLPSLNPVTDDAWKKIHKLYFGFYYKFNHSFSPKPQHFAESSILSC